ncbi:MAG TPA: peptidylprolyl isomerase [Micromonosporaceae bacterium]
MASSKQRARKVARARYERQMINRARRERRRRQMQAGIGATVLLALIVVGSVWLLGGFSGDKKTPTAQDQCTWTPRNASDANLADVGLPPTKGLPTSGTRPMTITTNSGVISVDLDLAAAPCAGASFAHLASRNFFDNTKCTELTTDGALRCGDKAGNGLGGPTYSFYGENVPAAAEQPSPSASPSAAASTPVTYPRGTVAMIANPPGSFGSQFLIFHKDARVAQPAYAIIGRVSQGMDVLDKIVKAGTVANADGQLVTPKNDVVIQSLTVGGAPTAAPTPASTTTPSATPSAS